VRGGQRPWCLYGEAKDVPAATARIDLAAVVFLDCLSAAAKSAAAVDCRAYAPIDARCLLGESGVKPPHSKKRGRVR
jgi:hypothetical protein